MDGNVTALWVVSGVGLAGEALGIAISFLLPATVEAFPGMIDDERERRRGARLFNERLKLFAAFLSGIGITFFITVAVAPVVQQRGEAISWLRELMALTVAFVLQGLGQLLLALWNSED